MAAADVSLQQQMLCLPVYCSEAWGAAREEVLAAVASVAVPVVSAAALAAVVSEEEAPAEAGSLRKGGNSHRTALMGA